MRSLCSEYPRRVGPNYVHHRPDILPLQSTVSVRPHGYKTFADPNPIPCWARSKSSRSESVAILRRIHKARHHPAWVVGCIEHLDPLQIESVRLPSQVSEVFHHRIRLMVILSRDFSALDNLS